MIDFTPTDEQQEFCEAVISFSQRELNDAVVERDANHEFSREAWQKAARFGIQGLPVPEEYGGAGADQMTIALALEALGYGCTDNGLLFSLNAQMWSCEMPILRFGTEEQKRRYVPALCDGSLIGNQGMTEPGTGSDAFAMSTTAIDKGDHFVLNGSKTFITNAPVADLFVVFAVTDAAKGAFGLSAFLLEHDTPGLSVAAPFDKMGLRTSPMSGLFIDDCIVPRENLLGTLGAGMALFNTSMGWERSYILATAVGTMRRQLETCVAYARERKQFGEPIGRFQSVSNKLVDMRMRVDTCQLLLYRLAHLRDQGKPATLEASLFKLHASEAYLQSSLDAVQIHGGYGYMTEQGIERDVRDAVASRIYSGTSEIQRMIAARGLGL